MAATQPRRDKVFSQQQEQCRKSGAVPDPLLSPRHADRAMAAGPANPRPGAALPARCRKREGLL